MTTETRTMDAEAQAEAMDALIVAYIECNRAINDWEAHKHRVRARMEGILEHTGLTQWATEEGMVEIGLARGAVDYRAAFEALMKLARTLVSPIRALELEVIEIEAYRKPPTQRFEVRPALRRAPGEETA